MLTAKEKRGGGGGGPLILVWCEPTPQSYKVEPHLVIILTEHKQVLGSKVDQYE